MSLATVASTAAIVEVDEEPQAPAVWTALDGATPVHAARANPPLTNPTAERRRRAVLG
jgi:hypothetical protein